MYRTISLFLIMLCTAAVSRGSEKVLGVASMSCEYLTNPIGVGSRQPRFSWQLLSPAGACDQKQGGFRVIVSDSEKEIVELHGNMWDTGWITSSQSVLVKYAGVPLRSNKTYYWRVMVSNQDGKISDWSETARFTTGLLSAEEWEGSQWIVSTQPDPMNHIHYRKTFKLKETPVQAFANIASVGYHELYVNGCKVDDRVLSPAQSQLNKRTLYTTYDIAPLLQKGENVVAVWYGPGWSLYTNYRDSAKQAIRAIINIGGEGYETRVATDSTWRCRVGCSRNMGEEEMKYKNMGGELFDNRAFEKNWADIAYDDSGWQKATAVNLDRELTAQEVEPTRIYEQLTPRSIADTLNLWRVDMGKNYTGWVRLRIPHAMRGDTIKIMVSDDEKNLMDFNQVEYYVCSGEDDVFCNRFNYFAGRYIAIEGLRQRPMPEDIEGLVIGTDLRRTGHFECSNELFNQIYETDLWTFRVNTIEGFVSDCPHRERLGYGEVATATSWGIALPNYASGAFYTKHIQDWIDVQQPNGRFMYTAPQMWGAGGVMWASGGMNAAWEAYQMYGDTTILSRVYPAAKRWVNYLHDHVKDDGILHPYHQHPMHFLGDWATAEGKKELGNIEESLCFNSCAYVMNLRTVIGMSSALGHKGDSLLYSNRLYQLVKCINRRFLHTEEGYYSNGLQVPQAFALWQNIVPDSLRDKVEQHFCEQIYERQPYLGMGSSGLPVLMHFLTENPQYDNIVARHLNATTMPSYGFFLSQGETAWPEYWTGDVPSKMHTCYTGIASWFMKSLVGIRPHPDEAGYHRFVVRPAFLSEVSYVKGSMETLYGIIGCEWRRDDDGGVTLKVKVPVNTSAIIEYPEVMDGKTIIRKEVGSGAYAIHIAHARQNKK